MTVGATVSLCPLAKRTLNALVKAVLFDRRMLRDQPPYSVPYLQRLALDKPPGGTLVGWIEAGQGDGLCRIPTSNVIHRT